MQVMPADLHQGVAVEDRLAGQHEVADGAEGVDVSPRVDVGGVRERFRRQEERRPGDDVCLGEVALVRCLDLLDEPDRRQGARLRQPTGERGPGERVPFVNEDDLIELVRTALASGTVDAEDVSVTISNGKLIVSAP